MTKPISDTAYAVIKKPGGEFLPRDSSCVRRLTALWLDRKNAGRAALSARREYPEARVVRVKITVSALPERKR